MMRKVTIKSHAKINLGLNIIRKRLDGFHDIETIFYPLDLCDVLTFSKSESFSFTCDNDELNRDIEKNLIVKAVRLLEKTVNAALPVAVSLEKNIPMGAGLGGGSSNAAVTLLSVNEIFQLGLPIDTLAGLALQLGSDVPYFLKLRPAFATARGEKLTYFNSWIKKHILVVNPGIHVSTAWAYSSIVPSFPARSLSSLQFDDAFSFEEAFPYMINDFEKSVFLAHPAISKIKQQMLECGAAIAMMSGSGSTVYGIFNELENAEAAASVLQENPLVFLEKFEDENAAPK
ncbi:MAG: 4-(cytidine 5'-diphospho)-2-C-methyl-D-erythritol kinase [Ignavibacteriales bacterium]|nr:4-(cytidine 5'-diphospho)-2-C-methyl-D-erythritol kinase [Ignavibacteriales bacterium]